MGALMEAIGFVGASGTGKSHRALVVAYENNVECIIDDGILIYHNRIVAGSSAKKEKSKIRAVRRAIFQDKEQADAVSSALDRLSPMKLMILGTSVNMVEKICKAIGIDTPNRYIRIEEVASKKEIEKARHSRIKEGKHIIPVPTMELKPHFKGYLIDPLKSIFRIQSSSSQNKETYYERSVVRPIFSYYGKLTFADRVIHSLIRHSGESVRGVIAIEDLKIRKVQSASNGLTITFSVSIRRGMLVKKLMKRMQTAISKELEYTTGMSVERMQITVKNIV